MTTPERIALLAVLAATFSAGFVLGDATAHTAPVALRPNADSVVIHPTPWEKANGRKVRTLPVCTELR